MFDLGPLSVVVTRTLGRVRLQRAIESATLAAACMFGLGVLMRVGQRWFSLPTPNEAAWLLASVATSAVVAALWPVTRESAAARLDRAHALHDRVRTALDFATREPRSSFMEAAIRDAMSRAAALSPQRAAPLRPPRARFALLGLGVLWLLAGMLPAHTVVTAPTDPPIQRARMLAHDELKGFREELTTFEANRELSPEAQRDVATYRALLEGLTQGELDEAQAIEALLSLEQRLMQETGNPAADHTALGELAKDLAKADDALAGALERQDSKAAGQALSDLAKKLPALSPAERTRLREALERVKKRAEATHGAQQREDELESLLKQNDSASAPPEEKSLLERNRRELERLRRENQAARERSRELGRLERELSEAAQTLGQNAQEEAQQSMQKGAEQLNRHGQDQGTRQQQEELAKQVAQLRELLQRKHEQGPSQQGPEKDQREQRRQRFMMRAEGEPKDGEQTKLAQAKPGAEGQASDAPEPGKEGAEAMKALELGGEGEGAGMEAVLPSMQAVSTETRSAASGSHDSRTLKEATDLESVHRDSQVSGSAGKGPTRSEVILDAADRGFATAPYRKVYSDYRSHAEEVLEKEDVPGGYRFYVRRYFQLIRPREERTAP